jgi:hypothetical protein
MSGKQKFQTEHGLMKVRSFFSHGTTRCGAAFLCGGLCFPGSAETCRKSLAGLAELDFSDEVFLTDQAAADSVVAGAVKACWSRGLLAVGVTVRIPGLSWRTGGVLGSPLMAVCPAESLLEDIGHGLWLYTAPGGPGLVGDGEKKGIAGLVSDPGAGLFHVAYNRAGMRGLYACLLEAGPKNFLCLSDGSGPGAEGVLCGRAENRCFFQSLQSCAL